MTELEELQRLRLLVEQQKLELEKQQVKIEKQQEELEKKDEIIRKKEIQIEHMIQALLHARKKLFGRSSEVTEGQLCLFETNQELAKQLSVEQKKWQCIVIKEPLVNQGFEKNCLLVFQK